MTPLAAPTVHLGWSILVGLAETDRAFSARRQSRRFRGNRLGCFLKQIPPLFILQLVLPVLLQLLTKAVSQLGLMFFRIIFMISSSPIFGFQHLHNDWDMYGKSLMLSPSPMKHVTQGGNELLLCEWIESQEILTPFKVLKWVRCVIWSSKCWKLKLYRILSHESAL